MNKTLVIVPCYNEKETLGTLIDKLSKLPCELDILIVDDNSPDGTGKIADEYARKNPNIEVLHRQNKTGLGDAYKEAFSYALAKHYIYIAHMDADGSHKVEQLEGMIFLAKSFDIVVGSRWVPEGKAVKWVWYRVLLSRLASKYVNHKLKLNISDPTSGYRVYKSSALKNIDFRKNTSKGYVFQVEMLYLSRKNNLSIIETPIIFHDREFGKSKINFEIIKEAFLRIIELSKKK